MDRVVADSQAFRRNAIAALEDPPPGTDPWFLRYDSDLRDDELFRRYVRSKQQFVGLAGGVRDRVVVDVGSGFGMVPNLLAYWGARKVVALELHAPMVESHGRILHRHFGDIAPRVHPVRGDAGGWPVRAGSADLVLSIEAISHYFDVDAFIDEAWRVLRPGGVLLISDGNNGGNPRTRRETEELWERLEKGPEGPCGDHVVPEPMESRRVRLIRERYPQMGEARAQDLALRTSGMIRSEIEESIDRHLAGGPAPDSRYQRGVSPREPVWGYWHEVLFDPPVLARSIARRGFGVRALPHYGGAQGGAVWFANEVLKRVPTFRYAHAFRIVARKPMS